MGTIKINNQSIAKLYLGNIAVKRAYSNGSIVYDTGIQPTPQPCFEVVTFINQASGDYVDVYVKADSKWYKRNNLNKYEEYGLMPMVSDLSSTTYYTGKLVILSTDSHEYKWNGSQWEDLGNAGTFTNCIWLDPATNNSLYNIGYYWGTGYKMVCNMYFSGSYSGDTGGFFNIQNKAPLELNFYSNGFYLDMHDPQSTSNNSCYSGDYSQRLMQTSVLRNYQSEQVINFTVTYVTVRAELEEDGTLIGQWGKERTGKSWYNGLYNPLVGMGGSKKFHLSRIQVYDNNNNLVNDLKFVENEGETGSQKLSMYDSVLDVKYDNTNSNNPTYHITQKGEIDPPVEYDTKVAPANHVHYNTLAELELMECPWVGMLATIGSDNTPYEYTENGWVLADVPLDIPYLRFTPSQDATFTFTKSGLKYSIDGGAWDDLVVNTATPTVVSGSYIIFKGSNLTPTLSDGIGTFSATGNFNVSGNVMSLLYDDDFTDKVSLDGKNYAFRKLFAGNTFLKQVTEQILPATTLSERCYTDMFNGCTGLTSVHANLLPATSLAPYCYATMFYNCSSLKTSPLLPATTLADYCYYTMFQSAGLTTLPALPATVMANGCYHTMYNYVNVDIPDNYLPATQLASYCYYAMFANGRSRKKSMFILPATTLADHCYDTMFINNNTMENAPVLPAETLVTYCYNYMFQSCSKITDITALFTTKPGSSYTNNWLLYTAYDTTGTFHKNPNATWDQSVIRGGSTVPSNWNIVDYQVPEYLKFTTVDDNGSTYAFSNAGLEYSIDGGAWTTLAANTNTPLVAKDHNIRFRGYLTPDGTANGKLGLFSSSGRYNASGNICTLMYGDYYYGQTSKIKSRTFQTLFQNSKIVDASALILPPVNGDYMYYAMFKDSKSLVTPPAINFTNAAYYGCLEMFYGCSSMTTVPSVTFVGELLTTGSLQRMFERCSSIVDASPIILNAKMTWSSLSETFRGCSSLQTTPIMKGNLSQSCANYAFYGCSNLTTITYLGTTKPNSSNSSLWLPSGCTATFYMNENATWDQSVTRDSDGVPSGCTIVKIDPSSV